MIIEEKRKIRRIRVKQRIIAEVDVNQLAEAIVLAEDLRHQRDEENLKTKGDYPSNRWMKTIVIAVFWGIAIVTCLASGCCVLCGGYMMYLTLSSPFGVDWLEFVQSGVCIVAGFLFAFVCMVTVATAKEIKQETDKHYVAAMFSNVVALVALIVSLVALIKG